MSLHAKLRNQTDSERTIFFLNSSFVILDTRATGRGRKAEVSMHDSRGSEKLSDQRKLVSRPIGYSDTA